MDKGLGFDQLRCDHWQNVSKFLIPQDLCRLMCVSHSFWAMWGLDRFWSQQKNRVCARFPELKSVFEGHRYRDGKPSASKKQKNTPLRLKEEFKIWSVFKDILFKGTTIVGLRECCARKSLHDIVFSVAMLSIPFSERIKNKYLSRQQRPELRGDHLNHVITLHYPSAELVFVLYNSIGLFELLIVDDYTTKRTWMDFDGHFPCLDRCEQWRKFLLQEDLICGWNGALYDFME